MYNYGSLRSYRFPGLNNQLYNVNAQCMAVKRINGWRGEGEEREGGETSFNTAAFPW